MLPPYSGYLVFSGSISALTSEKRLYKLPVVSILIESSDVPEEHFAPASRFVHSFNHTHGYNEELWWKNYTSSAFFTPVQLHNNNELTVKILDQKTGCSSTPSALDLNSGRPIRIWICRNEIISSHIRVGLVRRNSLNQQLTQDEELCALRLQLCILPRYTHSDHSLSAIHLKKNPLSRAFFISDYRPKNPQFCSVDHAS